MKINVDKLISLKSKLDKNFINYEQNFKKFSHEINNLKIYWKDNHANYFFVIFEEIAKNNYQFIEEINSILNIYDYIIDNYKDIGNKIVFDLNNEDKFISKINNYVNYFNEIVNDYKNLDCYFSNEENKILMEEKEEIITMVKVLENIKKVNIEYFRKIDEIEDKVKLSLTKIKIASINKLIVKDGVLGKDDNNIYSDMESIFNILKKLRFFWQQEEIYYYEFKELLYGNDNYYYTSNRDMFNILIDQVVRKFELLNKHNHELIEVLNLNLEKMKKVDFEVSKIIDDVNY